MFDEYIIKKDGILIKYFPAEEERTDELRIPEDIHTIGKQCFCPDGLPFEDIVLENWDNHFPVTKIIIPATVKKVEETAFRDVMLLEEFELEPGNKAVKLVDGVLYSYDGKTLLCCPPAKEGDLVLPAGVEIIGENAFEGCSLTSVTLNDDIREIHDDAFCWCFALEKIVVPSGLSKIGERAFSECDDLVVQAPENSLIWKYCKENGVEVST